MSAGTFAERINMSRLYEISRKNPDKNGRSAFAAETVPPRERRRLFGESVARFVVKVETDTQGRHSRSFRRPLEHSVNVAGYYLSFAREEHLLFRL